MLYASSTLALACLEVLVHIRDVGLIPADYVYSEVEVPEMLVTPWELSGEEALGKIESPVLSREYGDAWFRSARRMWGRPVTVTPVHAVPSVIIPREMNYLVSPVHPQFDQLAWGDPQPFRFDPRLIRSTVE
jgi:RES domain-containing protein